MDPISRIFQFGDGSNHDATVDETSTLLDPNCSNYVWNISPLEVGVAGAPLYTIEVSNDGVAWFDYDALFTNVATDDAVEDTQLSFTKIRVKHISGSASAGTVKYTLTQKQRN